MFLSLSINFIVCILFVNWFIKLWGLWYTVRASFWFFSSKIGKVELKQIKIARSKNCSDINCKIQQRLPDLVIHVCSVSFLGYSQFTKPLIWILLSYILPSSLNEVLYNWELPDNTTASEYFDNLSKYSEAVGSYLMLCNGR